MTWRNGFKAAAILLLFFWPFLYVSINLNDDAFVYYTYAKNFARGNFFAYDPRGIPSEGFTSILYMLLLVPFQILQIPLPLAGLLINVAAVFGGAVVSVKIYELLFPQRREGAWFAGLVFLVIAYLDTNITGLMGWGLETLVNMFVFLLLVHRFVVLAGSGSQRDYVSLLLLYGASIMLRPENLLVAAPWVVLGFMVIPSKKEGIKWSLIGGCLFGGFFLFKYLIFRDLVPTGFYRKVTNQPLNLSYLNNYLHEYALAFHGFYCVVILAVIRNSSLLRRNRTLKLVTIAFGLTVASLILFISKVNPIQGYMQRYLIVCTILAYLTIAVFLSLVLSKSQRFGATLALVIAISLYGGIRQRQRSSPMALYKDTLKEMRSDAYVELAQYLQKKIRNPAEVSLMFGDAGAIPYFFDCKFVDINGLTEPFLARMFKDKDRKLKVARYVSEQKVDIAVLAVENDWINLKRDSQRLPQGPLSKPEEYAFLLRQMKKDGFVYAGTVHYPAYELHFGINKNSPRVDELKKVLLDYVNLEKGFVKKGPLRIQFSDGDVIFENIHTKTL